MTDNDKRFSIEELIECVETEAGNRESAGFQGRYDDGGAKVLREQVKYYKMGLNREYPAEWRAYARHADPEYQEYLRLKNKFE